MKLRIAFIIAILVGLAAVYFAVFRDSSPALTSGYPKESDIQNLRIN